MKTLFIALLLMVAFPAAAICYVHPTTQITYCEYASECPYGTRWNQQTQACTPPVYGCFANVPSGPIMCVDPPLCGPDTQPVTQPNGTIICQPRESCMIRIDFIPGVPQQDLIYPVNGAVCNKDDITDALIRALMAFRK